MQFNSSARRLTAPSGNRSTMQLPAVPKQTPLRLQQNTSRRQYSTECSVVSSAAHALVASVDQADLVGTKHLPIRSLAAMAAEGKLELQENTSSVAFNSRKMASSLVLPVLQGKNTPPIVLEAAADVSGQETLHVREGSQRLRALLAFVLGSSSIGGQHWPSAPVELESRDEASIRWNGKRFSQLPEATRAQVSDYIIECMIVRSAGP